MEKEQKQKEINSGYMKRKTKRIGIYLIYDKEGIVDDYIIYLLQRIKSDLSRIIIVCNGHVNREAIEKLSKISSDIYIRENKGFDAGGFKDALTKYLKWEEIFEYEEMLLFNDSFLDHSILFLMCFLQWKIRMLIFGH